MAGVDPRPVNGQLWGEWIRAGAERWDVVQRSWFVFARNTTELIDLLKVPATNIDASMLLMGDDLHAAAPFWQELDQRLHNELASAVSLVDHTRRLLKHYKDDAAHFVGEYIDRNSSVTTLDESIFLRDLRNYLLHYGVAPVVQSLSLGPIDEVGMTGHSIKLSSSGLLRWKGWKAQSQVYLGRFEDRDGPVLARDVVTYANAMSQLFTWTLSQRKVLNSTDNAPERFRLDLMPG